MPFAWDERKRAANLRKHGIDFADAPRVFDGLTYTLEDLLQDYGQRRFRTYGLLYGAVVAVAHTIDGEAVRIISMRRATRHETEDYFSAIAN